MELSGNDQVTRAIRELLAREGVGYREIDHAPARSSVECARARGTEVRIGGKALVMKVGKELSNFVLSGASRVDVEAIKARFTVDYVRLATPPELYARTGLIPGTVPPFGRPVLPLDLYVDASILGNTEIAFNVASLTCSIVMPVEDYLRVTGPVIFQFSTRK